MKKLITFIMTCILLITITSPALIDYMRQAHGTHGLGEVNQHFVGAGPDPWDNPPGND